MSKIRVLIADDSPVASRPTQRVLQRDPGGFTCPLALRPDRITRPGRGAPTPGREAA